MINYTLKKIKPYIIFEVIMGSHAYGTALPGSDKDIRGIFIQPLKDLLKYGPVEQVSDEKNDVIFYELARFLDLLAKNNPNILELISVPEDCILYKDPLIDLILAHKNKFITKQCRLTFGGYAIAQIKKARGYNKKINWEENQMVRKSVLDFCYILVDGGSKLFQEWLEDYHKIMRYKRTQSNFGLTNINHSHNLYAMYDLFSKNLFSKEKINTGIVSDINKANDVQLTSIPKDLHPVAYLSFNKDAYSTHCKKYREYQKWLKERNEDRFKMNKDHGKNYDSKNMCHVFRLLKMALEIAKTGQVNVRRSEEEIKTLMSIRKGEYEYEDLLKEAENMIKELDTEYEKSNLPETINEDFIANLLLRIRRQRYYPLLNI